MQNQLRQEQFELFSGSSPDSNARRFSSFGPFSNVNLSWDNIILAVILCLMLLVVSFSLGFEKGKKRLSQEPVAIQPSKVAVIEKAPILNKATPPPVNDNLLTGQQPKELASETKRYTIQVASFEKQASAAAEVNKLKKLGYETWVRPSGKYNIICVGRFESKEKAGVFKKALQKMYNDCLIRRI